MSFTLSGRGLKRLENYSAARAYFNATQPYRGHHPRKPKPFGEIARRKKHMHIWMDDDAAVRIRYHDTDVIIYHANEDITITPWPSIGTGTLVNCVAPDDMRAQFAPSEIGCVLWTHNGRPGRKIAWEGTMRGHLLDDKPATFRRDNKGLWYPVTMVSPIAMPVVDMSKARAAYNRTGATDFAAWLPAYVQLRREKLTNRTEPEDAYRDMPTMAMLARRELWPRLALRLRALTAQRLSHTITFRRREPGVHDITMPLMLKVLRELVQRRENCVMQVVLHHFKDSKQYDTVRAAIRRAEASAYAR